MQMSVRSATSGICWQETRRRPYSESLQCPEWINSALGSETSRCCTESSQRRQREWCREVVKFTNGKCFSWVAPDKTLLYVFSWEAWQQTSSTRFQYLEVVNTVFAVMAPSYASYFWENLTWVEVSPSRVNVSERLWEKKVYPFASEPTAF